ncbi:MAG: phage tail protein [Rubrivivax sp.]|nr:phage tail protein [Rubrivivax sp.]
MPSPIPPLPPILEWLRRKPAPAPAPAPVGNYPPAAFYFTVSFGTATRDADCSFQEVSGIGAEMETETVVEGGENRFVYQLPKSVKHQRLVLKRGVAPFKSRLVTWCRSVLEGDLSQPLSTELMHVHLLDEKGEPLRSWSFENAYPVKWDVEPFRSNKNEVALEKIELTYLLSKRLV